MNSIVFGGRYNLKIFDSIIQRITIYVMNVFVFIKGASQVYLHNVSVFSNGFRANSNHFIWINGWFFFPLRSTFSGVFIFTWSAISRTVWRSWGFMATATQILFHVYHYVMWNILPCKYTKSILFGFKRIDMIGNSCLNSRAETLIDDKNPCLPFAIRKGGNFLRRLIPQRRGGKQGFFIFQPFTLDSKQCGHPAISRPPDWRTNFRANQPVPLDWVPTLTDDGAVGTCAYYLAHPLAWPKGESKVAIDSIVKEFTSRINVWCPSTSQLWGRSNFLMHAFTFAVLLLLQGCSSGLFPCNYGTEHLSRKQAREMKAAGFDVSCPEELK
jgi:hypothetical protein